MSDEGIEDILKKKKNVILLTSQIVLAIWGSVNQFVKFH